MIKTFDHYGKPEKLYRIQDRPIGEYDLHELFVEEITFYKGRFKVVAAAKYFLDHPDPSADFINNEPVFHQVFRDKKTMHSRELPLDLVRYLELDDRFEKIYETAIPRII